MGDWFRKVRFYFPKMLARFTGTDAEAWKEIEGQQSGCGLDWYFGDSAGRSAHFHYDQELFRIEIDGEIVFDGNLTEDARLKDCVEIIEDPEPGLTL